MLLLTTIAAFLTATSAVSAKSLPPNIDRCHKSDPNFSKCFEVSLQDGFRKFAQGNRDLAVNKLEPFFVESMDLGDSKGGSVSIHQVYHKLYLHGITETIIRNMDANFTGDSCYWRFDALTPKLRMEADYVITGQVLVFPLNGHGFCNNTLYDLDVRHEMKCEKYTKNGKKHLRILDYMLVMQPKRVVYNFENIINGNQQLSAEILKTINENSLAVYDDVKESFSQSFSLIYKQIGNQFLSKVPEDELFLP